jgi:hypothetical protein
MDSVRKLIMVRIVHTSADMGSMGAGLRQEAEAKVGMERWAENQKKIDAFWDELDKEILALPIDIHKARIYQDGLPVGGDMGLKIIKETAARGSQNYRLIEKLLTMGAVAEATEDPRLLLKEYGHIKAILEAKTPQEKEEAIRGYDSVKDQLIKERDEYIAKRIDMTLKEDETGLLFIGAAHDIVPLLDKDIEVKALD